MNGLADCVEIVSTLREMFYVCGCVLMHSCLGPRVGGQGFQDAQNLPIIQDTGIHSVELLTKLSCTEQDRVPSLRTARTM